MVSTRSFAVLGLCLAAGLVIFGIQIRSAVRAGRSFDRYLTVRGLSEREVKATHVLWPIRFSVLADDLPGLKSRMESNRNTVLSFLNQNGIATNEITFGIPAISDRIDERANGREIPRYRSVVTLVVKSQQVDVVKRAIQASDTLLTLGVTLSGEYGERPQFNFDGINDVKPSMIEEATANARTAAQKFAMDSKASVGAIRRASQGAMEIQERDVASPETQILRIVTTVDFFIE